MHLTLILGPMKSGKSFDLISAFAPLSYTNESIGLFHHDLNVRDDNIKSRNGVSLDSKKIKSVKEIIDKNYTIVGLDEVHMFPDSDHIYIKELLDRGIKVIAAGLDIDYKGEMFLIIKRLLELGPNEVRYKRAVCEYCKKYDAIYSQVLHNKNPVIKGLPPVLPEDGTYEYKAVCRSCFIKE